MFTLIFAMPPRLRTKQCYYFVFYYLFLNQFTNVSNQIVFTFFQTSLKSHFDLAAIYATRTSKKATMCILNALFVPRQQPPKFGGTLRVVNCKPTLRRASLLVISRWCFKRCDEINVADTRAWPPTPKEKVKAIQST